MQIHRLRPIAFMILAATWLQACGGGLMTGSNATQSSKKKQGATNADGDQSASDPSVVTGAYLACEVSAKDSSGQKTAVGCSVMVGKRQLAGTPQNRIDFYSESKGSKTHNNQLPATGPHQSLYLTPATDLPATKFSADIYNGANIVKTVSCSGKNLPCGDPLASGPSSPTSLQLTADGLWKPKAPFHDISSKMVLHRDCPNNPSMYCDAKGSLYMAPPRRFINDADSSACRNSLGQEVASLFQKQLGLDPLALFDAAPSEIQNFELTAGGETCVVKKRSAANAALSLLTKSEGCYSFMVRKSGQAQTVVIKKSNLANFDNLIGQLSRFECK